jgi:hypothetical protein
MAGAHENRREDMLMARETLLSAARTALRNYNIDMNKGGILTVPTQAAMERLGAMVEAEGSRPLEPPDEALARQIGEAVIDRDMRVAGLTFRAGQARISDILDKAATAALLEGKR